MKEFWMVWSLNGSPPTQKHKTEAIALAEAARLANLCPTNQFVILKATHSLSRAYTSNGIGVFMATKSDGKEWCGSSSHKVGVKARGAFRKLIALGLKQFVPQEFLDWEHQRIVDEANKRDAVKLQRLLKERAEQEEKDRIEFEQLLRTIGYDDFHTSRYSCEEISYVDTLTQNHWINFKKFKESQRKEIV